MPVPLVYSESIFADYLASVLDTLADTLGWDASDPRVQEAVTTALLEYGETNISAITSAAGILKLRKLGERAIISAAAKATSGFYSITDNGQRLERQQINANLRNALDDAKAECAALGIVDPGYAVSMLAIRRTHDPYIVLPDAERLP